MKRLAEILKSKRESKGMLLREVASRIDVDTALVSKIENEDRRPTKKQLQSLSKALDIDFTTLSELWYAEKIYEEIREENVNKILKNVKQIFKNMSS